MEIQHKDNQKNGAFFVKENGKVLAEMSYIWSGEDKIIIDHTAVLDALAGKGVGKQLVKKAVEMAREKHVKIIPLCPFAKKEFDKIEEYKDVLF